ncbi:hypothetical protein QKW60_15670 [Defluviimonas aestuarii]|uniref:hypothetical protein n=1 Tax=Albidovulum aestuarii TaxID=1130726 RepID=UPI00249AF065|nr:hypothetical protein [Defluviimonas aestuarii]MDI3337855.1 hypothetical protein [Defluviimonas aestuarii]
MTRIANAIRIATGHFIENLSPMPPQLIALASATRDCAPGLPNPFAVRRQG